MDSFDYLQGTTTTGTSTQLMNNQTEIKNAWKQQKYINYSEKQGKILSPEIPFIIIIKKKQVQEKLLTKTEKKGLFFCLM